ncbi:MAG: sensor histidine kinase [Rhodocyclaceae bacterium]|nr:sensor histidine kinase [Rhodocyclaceae bacterium]
MKLVAWVCSRIKGGSESALILSVWLIAIPACLYVLFLYLRPAAIQPPAPISQVERWIEPVSGYAFDRQGFALLAQKAPEFATAQWQAASLPDVRPLPAAASVPNGVAMDRVWFKLRYTPPPSLKAGETIVLYGTRIMGGPWSVWVDGRLYAHNLEDWRMQWNRPLLVKLPYASIRPGRPMEIFLAVPFREALGYAVGSLYVGSEDALKPLYDERVFWQESLPRAAILVVLLLGGISFLFWLARRSETPHLLLALTAVAWLIWHLQYFTDFSADETAAVWFGAIVDASISWVLVFIYLFAFRFHNRRFPRLELAFLAYATGITLVTLPVWSWGVYGLIFQHDVNLAWGLGTTLFISWLAIRGGGLEFRLVALSLWPMVFFAAHDLFLLTGQRDPDSIHLFPYAAFFVFGAFLFSIQRRYLLAMAGIEQVNASLDQRLRAREAELDIQHQQLRRAEQRQSLLNERQRLMRDMHDGIGSALMSSLALVEHGGLPAERLAEVLRECVDELKLVIDSLEPIGHDLVTLLAALRFRLGSRLEAAGITIDWQMEDLPPLPWLEPPQALQVLRILQEALTNMLKHAHAGEIRISARRGDGAGTPGITVTLTDNGVGFAPDSVRGGRGLKNMRERARKLGAELRIETRPEGGTLLELNLPFKPGNAP